MAGPRVKTLKLTDLRVDPELQSRDGLDAGTVEEYAELMRGGVAFPPGRVFRAAGGALWLAQGFHRVEAAARAGLAELDFEVVAGSRADAEFDSACANAAHGLPRTNKDKRRAVGKVLRLRPGWSDNQIAAAVGVTDKTVAKARRELEATSEIPKLNRRVGADGKTRPAKPARAPQADDGGPGSAWAEVVTPGAGGGPAEPAGPLPLRDAEGNYLVPLDDRDDPAAPPPDANWRNADGSVDRPGDLRPSPPDEEDDPAARVGRWRDRYLALVRLLKAAGAELGELLAHPQAGHYLRPATDERGAALFAERPRTVRSGRYAGGWHSPDLTRLTDAVRRAAAGRPCPACRGGGCDHCGGAGYFPAAAGGGAA